MAKLIIYPILILGSESGPAKAEKGGGSDENFGNNPFSAALEGGVVGHLEKLQITS